MKLATIITHPIQYYAPVFRLLNERHQVRIKVFYTWGENSVSKYDRGFGRDVEWDIPLLDGYDYEFQENSSSDPGCHHYRGIVNRSLIDNVFRWDADAVLIYGWNYHSHLHAIRYFKDRIPVYFRGDSTLLDERPGPKQVARRWFLRQVYRHVDKAFYVGRNNKAYYSTHGLREDQLIFAPHAVDNGRFCDEPGDNYETKARSRRRELGFEDDDFVVLFSGKLEPKKDPMLLLDAVREINNNRNKPMKLLYVGAGILEVELSEIAKEDKNIQFLGFQNQRDMPVVYRLGDLFCLPSYSETWGLAINEAMAVGKGIITSDKTGSAIDLIENGNNGFIFRNQDKTDLIQCLIRASKPGVAKRMGQASLNIIRNWSFENQVSAIESELLCPAAIKRK